MPDPNLLELLGGDIPPVISIETTSGLSAEIAWDQFEPWDHRQWKAHPTTLGKLGVRAYVTWDDRNGDDILTADELVLALVLTNGKVEQYHGPVAETVTVQAFGRPDAVTRAVQVFDGCGAVFRIGTLGWAPKNEFLEWLFEGLDPTPPPNVLEKLRLEPAFMDQWPRTSQQGSPRAVWNTLDQAVLPYYTAGIVPTGWWNQFHAWTDRQFDWRALHYYENGEVWSAAAHPGAEVAEGGQLNLRPEDPTRYPWGNPALNAYDLQHFEMTHLVMAYACTRDPLAYESAEQHVQTLLSTVNAGTMGNQVNPRALGWPLEAAAMWHKLTGSEAALAVIDAILARVRERMQLEPVPWLSLNPHQRGQADHGYRGVCTWMSARIIIGLDLLERAGREDLGDILDAGMESLMYAGPTVSTRGLATWASDYDLPDYGPPNESGNPFGSMSTTGSIWFAWWQMKRLYPERAPYLDDYFRPGYWQANHMRVNDKNADFGAILRYAPEYGYR